MKKTLYILAITMFVPHWVCAEILCDTNFGNRVDMGELEYQAMHEASGIAASRLNEDVFWTHQDAGDGNFIYAFSNTGKHLGRYRIDGFPARDWEDIAVGPGPQPGVNYIYIGNIGDNGNQYPIRYIARIPEPVVSATQTAVDTTLYGAEVISVQYPVSGNADSEALMVDPLTLDLYMVTKHSSDAHVYRIPYPQSTSAINTMVHEVTIDESWIVGGDISPSGLEILLKHGNKVYYWCRGVGETVGQAMSQSPLDLPYIPELQGEAVCWHPERRGYYTLSEGHDPHLYFYPALLDEDDPTVTITSPTAAGQYTTGDSTPFTVLGVATDNVDVVSVSYNLSGVTSGTGTCNIIDTVFVAPESEWKYLDNGSTVGPDWVDASFDDSAWSSGVGQLGYGDGDEATVVGYVEDSGGKNITTYYRKTFEMENLGLYTNQIVLKVQRDDGIIVYLNGTEVLRDGMPSGPVNKDTRASVSAQGSMEDEWVEVSVDASLLLEGENIFAAEVHQFSSGSSDTTFDLQFYHDESGSIWCVHDLNLNPGTTYLEVMAADAAGNQSSDVLEIVVEDPGAVDSDGDGQTDAEEAVTGTNPNDPEDLFQVPGLSMGDGGFNLTWTSVPGKTYRVMCSTNLLTGFHTLLSDIPASAGPTTEIQIDFPAVDCASYRVEVQSL